MSKDARKQSFYLPADTLATLAAESERTGMSISALVQVAIRAALPSVRAMQANPPIVEVRNG